MQEPPFRIVSRVEGLGWDVAVPRTPGRYDARMLMRLIRLVNRRGRVRYFFVDDREVYQHLVSKDDIKGVDDLNAFLDEVIASSKPGSLVFSFEDKFEARSFEREINNLDLRPEARERMQSELEARRRLAAAHKRDDYPEPIRFARTEGAGERCGYRWTTLVDAADRSALDIDSWMRRRTRGRYFAGVWQPNNPPRLAKLSWRYWRLKAGQWQNLIDCCRRDPSLLLIVHFFGPVDFVAFEARWGPESLLRG